MLDVKGSGFAVWGVGFRVSYGLKSPWRCREDTRRISPCAMRWRGVGGEGGRFGVRYGSSHVGPSMNIKMSPLNWGPKSLTPNPKPETCFMGLVE